MLKTRLHGWAWALLAGALISACGGGGGDDEPAAPLVEVPDSALTSSAAYTDFVRNRVADDNAQPLTLGRLDVAPTSETDEPVSLD